MFLPTFVRIVEPVASAQREGNIYVANSSNLPQLEFSR